MFLVFRFVSGMKAGKMKVKMISRTAKMLLTVAVVFLGGAFLVSGMRVAGEELVSKNPQMEMRVNNVRTSVELRPWKRRGDVIRVLKEGLDEADDWVMRNPDDPNVPTAILIGMRVGLAFRPGSIELQTGQETQLTDLAGDLITIAKKDGTAVEMHARSDRGQTCAASEQQSQARARQLITILSARDAAIADIFKPVIHAEGCAAEDNTQGPEEVVLIFLVGRRP